MKETAERERDDNLLACYYHVNDPAACLRLLGKLSLDRWNYRLFSGYLARYQEAVAFLMQDPPPVANAVKTAAMICRSNDDYRGAGRIYEQAGDIKLAARQYRDGDSLEDALRCYRAVNDEPNIARVYEKMGRLNEALAIWQKRGRKRDIERVRKNIRRQQAEESQLKLRYE